MRLACPEFHPQLCSTVASRESRHTEQQLGNLRNENYPSYIIARKADDVESMTAAGDSDEKTRNLADGHWQPSAGAQAEERGNRRRLPRRCRFWVGGPGVVA